MTIELFHLWDCPLSNRVRDFIQRNHLRPYVRYVDVEDELGAEDRLFDLTGLAQVPCLVIDDEPVRGTANIVARLKQLTIPQPSGPGDFAASPS